MRIAPILFALQLLAAGTQAVPLWRMNLPPIVRMAIRVEAGAAQIEDVNYTVDEGRPAYEVDSVNAGVERSFEIGADGTLLSRQVFLRELSAPVQQTISQLQRLGGVGDIYWSDDDGEFSYAVEVTQGGVKRFFCVGLDGWLVATPIEFAALPALVQKTVQTQLGRGTLFSLDRVDDYGEISVEVAMLKDGQRRTFNVDPKGELLSQQVYLTEVPAAVQATIQQYAGSARLAHIDLTVEGGQNNYEARVVKDGIARTATVGQDGKLLAQEIAVTEAPDAVQKALQEKAGQGRVVKLEKIFEEGTTSYEAEIVTNGHQTSVTVGEDGKVE